MKQKIVIAGGTGFIGSYFARMFRSLGHEVLIIARSKGAIAWTDREGIAHALNGADLLINLAGKSVDCRYNAQNKAAILKSRTETTNLLGQAVSASPKPPALWINSSTATIYRHAMDRPMTESGGEIGSGFSVDVAQQWEHSFFSFSLPRTRQVALRIAIVLGPGGGVLTPLKRLVYSGMGGRQGSGKQKFSWIHLEDLFRIILFLQSRPDMSGVYNCAAPHPVDNETLMRTLRRLAGIPFGIPMPAWLLEAGAVLIRTETELILKSRWVLPERLEQAGFSFRYPELEPALKHILTS
jgi:uncharacterized protein (TIGR01777 family)